MKSKSDPKGEVRILFVQTCLKVLNVEFVSPDSLLLVMLPDVGHPLPTLYFQKERSSQEDVLVIKT